ncbi:hypothetical protein K491DRAFT_717668 [Lophiostoma macrostomum CBS 122681]|uniref:Uncharacterized protein n=1 Tax=Lophiostoma macrostomum CBS 122681 TaxID=1314788 RepID=A0A6A6T4H7_9PLEO|nr:hypothetical protein K491DRAFT_717668 [Lophiostoma macrostomum CBS 122681]
MGFFSRLSRPSATSSGSNDDPPPPYNVSEDRSAPSTLHLETATEKPNASIDPNPTPIPYIERSPKEQLRRYLIKILVFTFSVDIEKLDNALGTPIYVDKDGKRKDEPKKNSTLSDQEKTDLYKLAIAVKRLHRKASTNCWNTTFQADRDLVIKAVSSISRDLTSSTKKYPSPGVHAAFALDLISNYADHHCDPALWTKTHLGQWTTNVLYRASDAFDYSIAAHAKLIGDVAPNEEVRFVLGHAQEAFQEKWGVNSVKATESYYMAIRDGYTELYGVLRNS